MTQDVFLSYSSQDKIIADAAVARLEAAGIQCWIAPRDIAAGRDWSEAIIDAIELCQVTVLIFSEHANQSHQIKREIERASSKGRAVLPMRIEDVLPSRALEYFIGSVHWLDAVSRPIEPHLDRLTEAVKTLLYQGSGSLKSAEISGLHSSARSLGDYSLRPASQGEAWTAQPTHPEYLSAGPLDAEAQPAKQNHALWFVASAALVLVTMGGVLWYFKPHVGKAVAEDRPTVAVALPMPAEKPVTTAEALAKGDAAFSAKNYTDALQSYRKAADLGNADAQNHIGFIYEHGLGVAPDPAEAMTWYRRAADQGSAAGQIRIAGLYYQGLGVARDYGQAANWSRKAASQGYAVGERNLGMLYEKGLGVDQDYSQAMTWYLKAADQGNAAAQHNIGLLYEAGLGVRQDYAEAMAWYRKAADRGDADAQFEIGKLYEHGQGVPQDLDQARQWMTKAAAGGSNDAKTWLSGH
jgi:TPR repeat protein